MFGFKCAFRILGHKAHPEYNPDMDLVYAWVASISSGLDIIIIKASSKQLITSPWLFNIFWILSAIPLLVVYGLARGGHLPAHWIPLILLGIVYAGFYILYTNAQYKLDVSTMGPLFSLRTVFAIILGISLLHEHLTPLDIALVTVIVLFSPLAAYDEHLKLKAFFQKPVLIAVSAMFLLALVGFFTNKAVAANGYPTTIMWQDPLVFLFLLPTLLMVKFRKGTISKGRLLPFVGLSILGFLYTVFATAAYGKNLALSTVIVSLPLSMIFVIIASKRYSDFLEKHPMKVYVVRFTSAAVMISCAILLTLHNR